jgi:hypothetical protein
MKLTQSHKHAREKGWAILATMSLAAAALVLTASVMTWSNENSTVIARNNEFFATSYAAEAATEKALSAMVSDDQDYGEGYVFTETAYYAGLVPTSADNPIWTNYLFSGGSTSNKLIVQQVNAATTTTLGPPYSGLISVGATYDIIANAKNLNSEYGIESTVGQKITFGQIPIFQFAIFYQNTMEIDPGANMNINGLVHGNTNIYLVPNSGVTLDFMGDLSASGVIYLSENPLDPTSRSGGGTVTFDGTNHISNVNPLNLPVGTNTSGTATNISQNVLSILQVPPTTENPNGPIGTNRLYNLTDLIVTISNGNVITVTSGVGVNGQATVISNNQWGTFISTNGSFYDGREAQTIDPVDINVGNLRSWSATNTVMRSLLATDHGGANLSDVSSIYVVDERSLSNAVVVTNILSYTTNTSTVTTTTYPSAGTFVPPVATNTLTTTSSNFPTAGTYMTPPPVETVSNQVTTTGWSSPPASGTYVGTVSSNWVSTNSTSNPPSGSYIPGSVTYSSGHYHYEYITGYTFWQVTGYIYSGITGYTYSSITGITTNYSYSTNYTQFALPGIVLTNGSSLPSNGLSIATPDPVYIVGNWNVYSNGGTSMAGSSNTANTLPSAVYADAITILSPSWNPANSTLAIGSRTASTDTVNAAFLTGNVPSNNVNYSGGVENFPRFLENWSGQTFYYNGSMVEMFPSQIANAPWPGTGSVYNPPTRDWTFDTQFTNPNNIPPLTPKIIYIQRSSWSDLAPGTLASGF